MRDIIFRGKRTDNGEWVEGYYVHIPNGRFGMDEHIIQTVKKTGKIGELEVVDPDTVGEWTGLYDKNGKQIFEGDIIRIEYTDDYIPEIYGPYEVRWHSEWLKWVYSNEEDKPGYFFEDLGELTYEDCEIIGNIHDNPGLIER